MPQEAKFKLNALNYVAMRPKEKRGGLTIERDYLQTQLANFADQFTVTGGQQQDDLQGATNKVFGSMINGFGLSRLPADQATNPDFYKRFWASNMETRFSSGIRQGILSEQSTETGLEVIRDSTEFKGDLWALWGDDSGTQVLTRKYDADASPHWQAGDTVDDGDADKYRIGQSIIQYKNSLVVAAVSNSTASNLPSVVRVFHGTDPDNLSASATQPSAISLGGTAITQFEDIDAALFAVIGGELILAGYQRDTGDIELHSTTDPDDWQTGGFGLELSIASGGGVQGLAVFQSSDGSTKLYLGTNEGLYAIDVSGTWTAELLFPMTNHTDNCRRMVVGQDGNLWFAQGVSNNEPAIVYRMDTSGNIAPAPNDLGSQDGVPADMLGPVRWMKASGGFVYAAIGGGTVGGSTGRKARVICHNGHGWHSMTQAGTADQPIDWIDISPNDDGVDRLHFGIRTAAGTSDTQFLAYPNANPESLTGTIKRIQSTTLDLPFFDGGMPTTLATWLQTQLSATSLTDASNEFVNVDYATDGTRSSFTDLGDFLSALTNLDWPSGATAGTGVSNRFVALRINMKRASGTATNDPIIHFITQLFLQTPPILLAYEFIVDLEASGRLTEHGSVTGVKTNLDAAAAPGVLVELVSAQLGTKYVKVKVDYVHTIKNDQFQGPGDTLAQSASGYAIVTCEEQV